MDFKLRILFKLISLSINSVMFSTFCHAEVPEEIKQLKYSASFNYYQALRQLGHVPSAQEKTDLAAKLYSPAMSQYEEAIQELNNQAISDAGRRPRQADKAPNLKSPPTLPLNSERSAPATIIDGSQFPKVLTFPGKAPKSSPKPSSSPRLPTQPGRIKASHIN